MADDGMEVHSEGTAGLPSNPGDAPTTITDAGNVSGNDEALALASPHATQPPVMAIVDREPSPIHSDTEDNRDAPPASELHVGAADAQDAAEELTDEEEGDVSLLRRLSSDRGLLSHGGGGSGPNGADTGQTRGLPDDATPKPEEHSRGGHEANRSSRLALDSAIHLALNLRPDSTLRPYMPQELLVASGGGAGAPGGGQPLDRGVLPSTLTSEELRLLEDVRRRLASASVSAPQEDSSAAQLLQQRPPRPRPRQRLPEPYEAPPAAAVFLEAGGDSDDPLLRSTHERLAGVSDRIRHYQRESCDFFNRSVLLGLSPTERERQQVDNNGHPEHNDELEESPAFGSGGYGRYNGHYAANSQPQAPLSPLSSSYGSSGAEPSVQQLSPADAALSWQQAARQQQQSAAIDREDQQQHLVLELRRLRADLSEAREQRARLQATAARAPALEDEARLLRRHLEEARAALRDAAEGAGAARREQAVALARAGAEAERLRCQLVDARAEVDTLRRRLAGAESELMFLRNRERGFRSRTLSGGDWLESPTSDRHPRGTSDAAASALSNDASPLGGPAVCRDRPDVNGVGGGGRSRSPSQALRQSLADLERRQLIDSLPQAPASLHRGGGGGGGGHQWDRDTQLAEMRALEQRYDELQAEKRRVESALTHVPLVGSAKYGRQSREDKERMETRLDSIDRELGSLRITLRQFHIIRSAN